jgi:hypothetical protein
VPAEELVLPGAFFAGTFLAAFLTGFDGFAGFLLTAFLLVAIATSLCIRF